MNYDDKAQYPTNSRENPRTRSNCYCLRCKTSWQDNTGHQVSEKFSKVLYLNCDDPLVVSSLTEKSAIQLKAYVGSSDLVIIDEAQRVENIGISIKLIHDTYPEIKLLVTGSSSLDLANKITEPLTGRSEEVHLFPLSIQEVSESERDQLPNALVQMDRGAYPAFWSLSAKDAHFKAL